MEACGLYLLVVLVGDREQGRVCQAMAVFTVNANEFESQDNTIPVTLLSGFSAVTMKVRASKLFQGFSWVSIPAILIFYRVFNKCGHGESQ